MLEEVWWKLNLNKYYMASDISEVIKYANNWLTVL